jgi:hypothetical protein
VRANKNLLKILLGLIVTAFLIVRFFFYNWTLQTHFFIPLESLFDLGPYFLMGSLLSLFDLEKLPAKNGIALFLLSVLILGTYIQVGHTVVYFTLPFLVIYVGKKTSGLAAWVHTKLGDPSYGIYLYAFPLQQILIYFYKPSTFWLFVMSSIGAFVFGYFSWMLITTMTSEDPLVSFKYIIARAWYIVPCFLLLDSSQGRRIFYIWELSAIGRASGRRLAYRRLRL